MVDYALSLLWLLKKRFFLFGALDRYARPVIFTWQINEDRTIVIAVLNQDEKGLGDEVLRTKVTVSEGYKEIMFGAEFMVQLLSEVDIGRVGVSGNYGHQIASGSQDSERKRISVSIISSQPAAGII